MPRQGPAPAAGAAPHDEHEALSVSHWFDSGSGTEPYTATVRFTGTRLNTPGKAAADHFTRDEQVVGVVPGSGPVSITTWVHDLQPGEWSVAAELVGAQRGGSWQRALQPRSVTRSPIPRAAWSWRRWSLSPGAAVPVRTRFAPLVRLTPMPAVVRGSWSGLIAIGILVGFLVQTSIAARNGVTAGQALLIDLVAVLAGLIGAKAWFIALRPRAWRQRITEGWSVDGSIVAAPLAGALMLASMGLPIASFLDASTPAFFFGVAIGRVGCFLTGCCAGRCTRAWWGIWSSDRRVGARRIPTQLMESVAGLAIGALALLLANRAAPPLAGAVFVGGVAAYVLVRQGLLRLRAERRAVSMAASIMAVLAAGVLLVDAVAIVAGVA